VVVFLWEMTLSETELMRVFLNLAVIPAEVSRSPFSPATLVDVLRSMFFHGGWLHLLGNMLYLYLFGDNVEDRLGEVLYLLLYFVSGYAAVLAQVVIDPTSTVPLVGASGAIAGVLGSYLVMFPGVRVRGIIPLGLFSQLAEWPAVMVLALWFGLQLLNGVLLLGVNTAGEGGVAFFAHVGGFVVGIVFTWVFMLIFPQPPADDRREMLYERAQRYRY
jgi:membrane associated rhomboid family serine protease